MLATKALGLVLVACSALGLAPSPVGPLGSADAASLVGYGAQTSPVGTKGSPGKAANVAITKALDAQIRASYYEAYLHDPKPRNIFGVPAGRPESSVRQPYIESAGVIYGRSAATNSYWVVAAICFNTLTGCEDMGGFQVFHRTGSSGDFAYGTFGICDIPRPLANKWYPDDRYPMGVRCPSAALASLEHLNDTHAGSSALSAPVITEHFEPVLPCNQNTTLGQEGCGEHEVLAADKQLNADVKIVFALLGNAAARAFVTAETTWMTYRTEDCTSQSDIYQGGTELPVVYAYCLASDDSSRRQDLKAFYAGLTQGMAKAPKFP
ncbi:MAG: lysozyme inhibitor LprI family protein [Acidimicrobiales bacterium]|jgi:uncharacterized protein YecT (DUF1311 family)